MIYRVRTINLDLGKTTEAKQLTTKAATYISRNYADITVEVLENVTGSLHQIHMVTRCNSLGALEAYEEKRQTDPKWQALLEEWEQLAAHVGDADRLYRTVSSD